MEFLKKMRSREMIEMSLKAVMLVVIGIVLIFLMEGMIYGIYMKEISKNKSSQHTISDSVAYCELAEDGKYTVYLHNETSAKDKWFVETLTKTKAEIESADYKEVIWRAPNPFEVSITGTHYIVMTVFITGLLGFYGWRFYKLNKEYKGFEKKYKKTGKIF